MTITNIITINHVQVNIVTFRPVSLFIIKIIQDSIVWKAPNITHSLMLITQYLCSRVGNKNMARVHG